MGRMGRTTALPHLPPDTHQPRVPRKMRTVSGCPTEDYLLRRMRELEMIARAFPNIHDQGGRYPAEIAFPIIFPTEVL
jgi:hypothetical protein